MRMVKFNDHGYCGDCVVGGGQECGGQGVAGDDCANESFHCNIMSFSF